MTMERKIDECVALVREMNVEERKAFLAHLGEHVCLLCGEDAPCYCDPAYDEYLARALFDTDPEVRKHAGADKETGR